MLNVQKFLLGFKDKEKALTSLNDKYHIDIKEYPNDLYVLNYNQIESPRFDPIADECRGLILSEDFTKVYCRAYDRFYNYGEGGEKTTKFNIEESVSYSKEDGSLLNMWFHPLKNTWNFATRKMAYAEGFSAYGISFNDIASIALNNKHVSYAYMNLPMYCRDYTWIHELTSHMTRVVKHYNETKLYLTGVRNNITGEYMDIEEYVLILRNQGYDILLPEIYYFNTYEDVSKSMKDLKPLDEGYVCFNAKTGERVKIKSPAYVAVHHLRDNGNINPRRVVTLVFENEYEEYLSYFPEDKQYFEKYINAYNTMIDEINDFYNIYKDIKNQKEFALAIIDLPFNSILFELRKGNSLVDVLSKIGDERKMVLLDMFIDNKWKQIMKENACKKKK